MQFSNPNEKQEALQRLVQAVRDGALWSGACAQEGFDPAEAMGWLMEARALHSLPLNPFERRRDPYAKRTPAELSNLARAVLAYVRLGGPLKEALALGDTNFNMCKRGLALINLKFDDSILEKKPRVKAPAKEKPPKEPRPTKPVEEMQALLARVAEIRGQGHSLEEAAKLAGTSGFMVYYYRNLLKKKGVEAPWGESKNFNREQVIPLLKQVETLVDQGMTIKGACAKTGLALHIHNNWLKKLKSELPQMGFKHLGARKRGKKFTLEEVEKTVASLNQLTQEGLPFAEACKKIGLSKAAIQNRLKFYETETGAIPPINKPAQAKAPTGKEAKKRAVQNLLAIQEIMRGGASLCKACRQAGCSPAYVRIWRKRLLPEFEKLGLTSDLSIRPWRQNKGKETPEKRAVENLRVFNELRKEGLTVRAICEKTGLSTGYYKNWRKVLEYGLGDSK